MGRVRAETTFQENAFEAYTLELAREHKIPGLAVVAARDGFTVYARGFGFADVEHAIPAGADTVFGVGSVTKSFTAAAIMRLQDAGRLSAGDPAVKYLPELRIPGGDATKITIHHFLTHTAGLPPLPSRWYAFARSALADPEGEAPPVPVAARPPIETPEDLMAYLAESDWVPLGPPGAQFSYSNEGYALLGAIVARVSGRAYARYVIEEILEPAGLHHTTFGPRPDSIPLGMATPYISRADAGQGDVVPARSWWYSETWLPAGGVCSTAADLVRYLELFCTGGTVGGRRILSEARVAAMTGPHIEVWPGVGYAYGYGLSVLQDYRGGALFEHGGGRRSISAHVAGVPARGLAVVALANLANVPVRAIANGLLNVLAGMPVETPPLSFPDYACPAERLAAYVGEYRSGEGAILRVRIDGAVLVIDADGLQLTARPVGVDAFVVRPRGTDQYVRFLMDDSGRARAILYGLRIIARAGMNESHTLMEEDRARRPV